MSKDKKVVYVITTKTKRTTCLEWFDGTESVPCKRTKSQLIVEKIA